MTAAITGMTAGVSGPEAENRDRRSARGKAKRARVPRSSHARLDTTRRPDPIALLAEQERTRIPELLPVRHGRMLESPFAFFRGAALVMASDLSRTPTTAMRAQLCGDAHLANFGMFATPERTLVFDTNDFDETLPGPWEWDVKRLAASFELAGRANGFAEGERQEIVLESVRAYQEAMRDFATRDNLDLWYCHMAVDSALAEYESQLTSSAVKRSRRAIAKARRRDSERAMGKLTRGVRGAPHIVSDPPILVPLDELYRRRERAKLEGAMRQMFLDYRQSLANNRRLLLEQFRFVEMARKVVGVGSVGTHCWIVLLVGINNGEPLFLQIKEAQPSVLARFTAPSRYDHEGHRVVAGQRAMQATSDILLGWGRAAEIDGVTRDYYMRQLHDWKGSFLAEEMNQGKMKIYAKMCGWTLARAHARSGDRVAIAAYLGKSRAFARAACTFARAYADLSERDHETLVRAVRAGRVAAATDVRRRPAALWARLAETA
jgi:uncharacterized protein (DUF2252 family)